MKQWQLFNSFENSFKSRELNHIEENFEISQDEDFPSISR